MRALNPGLAIFKITRPLSGKTGITVRVWKEGVPVTDYVRPTDCQCQKVYEVLHADLLPILRLGKSKAHAAAVVKIVRGTGSVFVCDCVGEFVQ